MPDFFETASPFELRKTAGLLGTKRLDYVEIDVLLTHLLQRLHEVGEMDNLVFKGGTMLRKMVFGQTGRLSTDLDFGIRCLDGIDPKTLADELALHFTGHYRSIDMSVDFDRHISCTETSARVEVLCATAGTPEGRRIKVEVSLRGEPVLEPEPRNQIRQPYFDKLGFTPEAIPCLRLEEAIAEKIRAAYQRPKIRDLHDLQQLRRTSFDPDLVRRLLPLKLWEAPEAGDFVPFSHEAFAARLESRRAAKGYAEYDLKGLIRTGQEVDLAGMTRDVADTYSFLKELGADAVSLCDDRHKARANLFDEVRAAIREDHHPDSPRP